MDPRWRWPVPLWLDRLDLPLSELQMNGGIPLSGREVPSFPPIEAVCLYGGPVVEQWLASERLTRMDYDDAAGWPGLDRREAPGCGSRTQR